MTMIAPMSSAIASATRNTFRPGGTRSPSSAITPMAKAMSVAIGMPQPCGAGSSRVERQVDQRRNDHAADRREDRQHRLAANRQLADEELALDLEPDDEEEERHQQVVDPVHERLAELPSRRPKIPTSVCQNAS